MSAAGSTNWTRNAAPPAPAVQAGRGRRGEPTQDGRAGGRAATRRGTPADRGTRGPGPVCRTGGAADKAGGGTGRGALGGGTGGREREGAGREPGTTAQRGANSDGRAAGPDPGAGWATGRADPASDDADHAGAGRSGNGDRAGERLSRRGGQAANYFQICLISMGRHAAEDERSTQPAKAGAPSSYFSDGARTNRRPGAAGAATGRSTASSRTDRHGHVAQARGQKESMTIKLHHLQYLAAVAGRGSVPRR